MFKSNSEEECISELNKLFQAVSQAKGTETVGRCLRHLVDLSPVMVGQIQLSKLDFYLLPECLHNSTNLSTFINYLENNYAERTSENIVMLKLYSYVQCIEMRYIYKVVGNLLGELGGGKTSGDLYDDVFSSRECFKDIKKRHDMLGKPFNIIEHWNSILDFDLRNAIGHSDFIINNQSQTVQVPNYILQEVTGPKGKKIKKSSYSFSEIHTLYSNANDFVEAFKDVIQKYGVNLGPRY